MPRKPKPPAATHTFRAVWPVIEDTGHTADELIQQAKDDLPNVANRHNAQIIGEPRCGVLDGRRVPGSGGAARVVVIEAPAIEAAGRGYRHH